MGKRFSLPSAVVKPRPTACAGCGANLGEQARRGNPRKWCTGSCRAWTLRNPGAKRPRDEQGRPRRANEAPLERRSQCNGCGREFLAVRASPDRVFPVVCSTDCKRVALLRGIATRRPGREKAACAVDGCDRPEDAHGHCKNHYEVWLRANDPEKLKAKWRARNRKRRAAGRYSGIAPARELQMRRNAKDCPLCRVVLTDEPFLPNSKELDRVIPGFMGGTYTEGNVRITCRACNQGRPKDGSDYTGPVTLFAELPGFIPPPTSRAKTCLHGVKLSYARCTECNPYRETREADGRRAAQLRAEGWEWRDIAHAIGALPSNAATLARRYGAPETLAHWPPDDPYCLLCNTALPRGVKGRPRKYCDGCRPSKRPLLVEVA